MNREKAIDLLDNLIGMVEDNQESDYDTALKMGKQALSQEPTEKPMCDRNICISNEYNGIGCDECIVNKVGHKPCRVKNELNVELNELKPCDDAISREDALKLIYDFKEKHTEDRKKHPINYGTLLDLIRLIRELPPVTQKSAWIPVSERLPEDGQIVIASTEYIVNGEARYTKEYGWEWLYEASEDYWKELEGVIAWMPLPEPYEPQESEDKE